MARMRPPAFARSLRSRGGGSAIVEGTISAGHPLVKMGEPVRIKRLLPERLWHDLRREHGSGIISLGREEYVFEY